MQQQLHGERTRKTKKKMMRKWVKWLNAIAGRQAVNENRIRKMNFTHGFPFAQHFAFPLLLGLIRETNFSYSDVFLCVLMMIVEDVCGWKGYLLLYAAIGVCFRERLFVHNFFYSPLYILYILYILVLLHVPIKSVFVVWCLIFLLLIDGVHVEQWIYV